MSRDDETPAMTHRPTCPGGPLETTASTTTLAGGVRVYVARCGECGAIAVRTGKAGG